MAYLGERHWYKYTADDGKDYKILLMDYLAVTAELECRDDLPMLPRRWEPRYVWLQATECTKTKRPARKKLIVQIKDLDRFKIGTRVKVAGIEMKVTSYIGERATFGKNIPSANPLCK